MQDRLDKLIAELNAMEKNGDNEIDHQRADSILVEYLALIGHQAVAQAYQNARERVTFWYS
jgi:hypothetical protein